MANRESGIGNRDWGRTPSAFPYSPLLAPLSYWWAEVERQEAALDRQIERKIRLLVELQRRRREPERVDWALLHCEIRSEHPQNCGYKNH